MESNHVSGQACKDFLILTLPLTYPLNEGFTGVKTAAFHNGTEKSKYNLQRMLADRCQHTNHEKHKFN